MTRRLLALLVFLVAAAGCDDIFRACRDSCRPRPMASASTGTCVCSSTCTSSDGGQ